MVAITVRFAKIKLPSHKNKLYNKKGVDLTQSVSSNNQSWGSDYSNFVNSSNPWFKRGGNSNNGSNAGVFASNNNNGNGNNNVGFRVVAGSF
jgi:hypothetical protein